MFRMLIGVDIYSVRIRLSVDNFDALGIRATARTVLERDATDMLCRKAYVYST